MRRRDTRPIPAPSRLIQFPDHLLTEILAFQRDNGMQTLSEAVQVLVDKGLETEMVTLSEEELLAGIEALAPPRIKH